MAPYQILPDQPQQNARAGFRRPASNICALHRTRMRCLNPPADCKPRQMIEQGQVNSCYRRLRSLAKGFVLAGKDVLKPKESWRN